MMNQSDIPQYLPPQLELPLSLIEWSIDSFHDAYEFDSSMTFGFLQPIENVLHTTSVATMSSLLSDVVGAIETMINVLDRETWPELAGCNSRK